MVLYIFIAVITTLLACRVETAKNEEYDYIPLNLGGTGSHNLRILMGYTTRRRALSALCLVSVFVILTALAALRLEVGNDYGTYVVTCHEIFQRGYVVTEPGYNLVVRILYTLSGKEDYLLMFGVFGAAIVAVFLKVIRDQSDCFALGFFVFMFLGFYYRSFNTVRYYFALAIATFALRYVVKPTVQGMIKFFVIILFAAAFHKSVLIVIPMYFIARIPWKKWVLIPLVIVGGGIALLRGQIMDIAVKLYPSYKNTVYLEEVHTITENAAPILGCLFVLGLCIYCYREAIADRADNRMYFNMNIMALVMYVSCYFIPFVTRLVYYLTTAHILLLPSLVCSVKNKKKKKIVLALVIIYCILYFLYFLRDADKVGVRVLPYKSWLFYDHRWLNQTDTF